MVALDQFETFKRKTEERETQLKTEHAKKLLQFSQEVLLAKNDFQEKVQLLDNVKAKREVDKMTEIEMLKEKHRQELSNAIKQQHSLTDLEQEKEVLTEKYKRELDELNQRCQMLEQDKIALTKDFEHKLNESQSFYENKITAIKDAQSKSENEQLRTLRKKKQDLSEEFANRESQHKTRIDKLLGELTDAESKCSQCESQLEQLNNVIKDKDSSISEMKEQVGASI